MINSHTSEYYHKFHGACLVEYLSEKDKQDARVNRILLFFLLFALLVFFAFSRPIFAQQPQQEKTKIVQSLSKQTEFETRIKQKYYGATINFPTKGIAHIKKIKYINSKPIKINIVEINTSVNPYLKVKPQTASKQKLNSKATVRRIAQRGNGIVAINAGFFKPQTGVPLGALMIDNKILSGPIYNRVGIAIFENEGKTSFKLDNINFDIKAINKGGEIKIDNINQPRMLSTYKLLYTKAWGEFSPVAPKNCYNMLIENEKITKISANPIELSENKIVIQAPKETIQAIGKYKDVKIEINVQESLKDAKHIIGAGPYLVKDGEIFVDYKTEKFQAIQGKNPRSAVGFNEDNLIIVTVDGREKKSVGMTLFELAKLMKDLDCKEAMNFDGGSSSALYVNKKIVNSAINKEGIAVSNALVISENDPFEMKLSSLN